MNNKKIYLPIKSLGDFVITAAVLKNGCNERVPVILPPYFKDLYDAIQLDNVFENVGSIGFTNQPIFFEFYKVRGLKQFATLIKHILKLKSSLKRDQIYLLDDRSRRISFLGIKFEWPYPDQKRYSSKYELFSKNFSFNKERVKTYNVIKPGNKITIFPDSRIKEKEISPLLIKEIFNNHPSKDIVVAKFSAVPLLEAGVVTYSNFNQLIKLINDSDFIISADSLPYHLCYYYEKQHFVIYNQTKKFFTKYFRTPFIEENNYYSIVSGADYSETLSRLSEILK